MQSSNSLWNVCHDFVKKHKLHVKLGSIVGLLCLWVICGLFCFWYEKTKDISTTSPQFFSKEEMDERLEALQVTTLDAVTAPENATVINLAEYTDECVITKGGYYTLFGELKGTIRIAVEEDNIHLFLDNVSISSKLGPAIYCETANKLMITLLPETENYISDFGDYRGYEESDACIYSESSLTFNGTGKLFVYGYYKDAIRSKDVVKFLDGTYEIKCKRNAIHGNDGIVVREGRYTISSEKDGFRTTKKGAQGRGSIALNGGDFSVIAGQYAFHLGKADLYISDCKVVERSVVDTFKLGGNLYVQEGCMQ